jgi:hypothetical protein
MASKITSDLWDKARSLFEADKSFREIAKRCPPLDSSNIAKKAKKEGWQRGVLPQLIIDKARIDAEFTTLLPRQQAVVVKEVDERNRYLQYFNNSTMRNISIMMKKVNIDTDISEHRVIQSTLKEGKETVLGKTPDTVINNSNAQQNNHFEPFIIEIDD